MADLVLSPKEIAEKLHHMFLPVLEHWIKANGTSPALEKEAQGKHATRILTEDLKELGRYMICGDDRATRIELGLMVDCLAALQAKGDEQIALYTAEILAEEFDLEHLKNAGSTLLPVPDAIDLPLSLRITMDAERLGLPFSTKSLRDIFLAFMDSLILRDGLLTSEEIAHGKKIEDILITMSESAVNG